ncbi:MAG: prenyltransferase/squalene oxidase repeat-containing protein [Planctomycetota bacterium]|jgi:hypothetical protein
MRTAGFFALITISLLGMIFLVDSVYTDEEAPSRDTDLSPAGRAAIDRGLAFLAKYQGEDGAWKNVIGYKLNTEYRRTGEGDHVGVTALAGMAFLANGHLPTRGKYARNVRKALDFVLACVDPNNGFITYKQTRMYSHAFAALFLAEIYGMTPRADLKEKLKLVVDLLVHSQNERGGWRYLPFAKDADISLTVCQLQVLRAARNCGISVPPSTIKRAVQYVERCRVDKDGWGPSGAFRYQESRGAQSRITFSLTAAGLTSLNAAGVYNDPLIASGLQFLIQKRPSRSEYGQGKNDYHYFYGHYYAIQAFYQAGGRYWKDWWEFVQQDLVKQQKADGSWRDEVGSHYATAMATLILSVPLEYLPIFQR